MVFNSSFAGFPRLSTSSLDRCCYNGIVLPEVQKNLRNKYSEYFTQLEYKKMAIQKSYHTVNFKQTNSKLTNFKPSQTSSIFLEIGC